MAAAAGEAQRSCGQIQPIALGVPEGRPYFFGLELTEQCFHRLSEIREWEARIAANNRCFCQGYGVSTVSSAVAARPG